MPVTWYLFKNWYLWYFFKNIFRYATSYTDKRSIYSGSRDNYKFKLIPAKVICIAKSTCICPDLFEILAKAYCHFAPFVHLALEVLFKQKPILMNIS